MFQPTLKLRSLSKTKSNNKSKNYNATYSQANKVNSSIKKVKSPSMNLNSSTANKPANETSLKKKQSINNSKFKPNQTVGQNTKKLKNEKFSYDNKTPEEENSFDINEFKIKDNNIDFNQSIISVKHTFGNNNEKNSPSKNSIDEEEDKVQPQTEHQKISYLDFITGNQIPPLYNPFKYDFNDKYYNSFGQKINDSGIASSPYQTANLIDAIDKNENVKFDDLRMKALIQILDLSKITSTLDKFSISNFNDLILIQKEDFDMLGLPLAIKNRLIKFNEEYKTIANNFDLIEILTFISKNKKFIMNKNLFDELFEIHVEKRPKNITLEEKPIFREAEHAIINSFSREEKTNIYHQYNTTKKQNYFDEESNNKSKNIHENKEDDKTNYKIQFQNSNPQQLQYDNTPKSIGILKKNESTEDFYNNKLPSTKKLINYEKEQDQLSNDIENYLNSCREIKQNTDNLNSKIKIILSKTSQSNANFAPKSSSIKNELINIKEEYRAKKSHAVSKDFFEDKKLVENINYEDIEEEQMKDLDNELNKKKNSEIKNKEFGIFKSNKNSTSKNTAAFKINNQNESKLKPSHQEVKDEINQQRIKDEINQLYKIWEEKDNIYNNINLKNKAIKKKVQLMNKILENDNSSIFDLDSNLSNVKLTEEEMEEQKNQLYQEDFIEDESIVSNNSIYKKKKPGK